MALAELQVSETQESICEWAETTFGTAGSTLRVLTRANEEMAELLVAAELYPGKAPEEAADIAIVLCRALKRLQSESAFDVGPVSGGPKNLVSLALTANSYLNRAMNAADALCVDGKNSPRFEASISTAACGCIRALSNLCAARDTSLQTEVDKKMATNRKRVWNLDGEGHGYHCGA